MSTTEEQSPTQPRASETLSQPNLPPVIVRDYAFASSDPRFHGRPLPKPAGTGGGPDTLVTSGRFRSTGGGVGGHGAASASTTASIVSTSTADATTTTASSAHDANATTTTGVASSASVQASGAAATHDGTVGHSDRPSDDDSEDHGDGRTERLFESDDSEDDTSDDIEPSGSPHKCRWSWVWTSRMTAAAAARAARSKPSHQQQQLKPLLPLLKSKELDIVLLPSILSHMQMDPSCTNSQSTSPTRPTPTRLWRVRAIFPFAKANDCEMSLESGDEVIAVSTKPVSLTDAKHDTDHDESKWSESDPIDKSKSSTQPKPTTHAPTENGIGERWSSIDDELDDDDAAQPSKPTDTDTDATNPLNASTASTSFQSHQKSPSTLSRDNTDTLTFEFDPPVRDIMQEIHQFMEYHESYGTSWILALKLRIKGGWITNTDSSSIVTDQLTHRSGVVRVQLRDLGLVPGNYVEPQS